jgi:hypothetical protein
LWGIGKILATLLGTPNMKANEGYIYLELKIKKQDA